MSRLNIIRAWKDEEYRRSLSDEERKLLPENPAGLLELDEKALNAVAGGVGRKSGKGTCGIGRTNNPSGCP